MLMTRTLGLVMNPLNQCRTSRLVLLNLSFYSPIAFVILYQELKTMFYDMAMHVTPASDELSALIVTLDSLEKCLQEIQPPLQVHHVNASSDSV